MERRGEGGIGIELGKRLNAREEVGGGVVGDWYCSGEKRREDMMPYKRIIYILGLNVGKK